METKNIFCPVNELDCPYYAREKYYGICTLENPLEECDDFASFWDEDDDWSDEK